MGKLFKQILRFAVVGGISFIVDFIITNVVARLIRGVGIEATTAALIGALLGFLVSIVVNYMLSMRWVFARKDDMNRAKEFTIFVVLSVIGLGLNELIILGCMTLIENVGWCNAFTQWCTDVVNYLFNMTFEGVATAGSKIIATAVVMVFNFVTRKIFLEKKEDDTDSAEEKEEANAESKNADTEKKEEDTVEEEGE
ncbi:MAG: GtrA family protein [Lachnospiraceae bacterium]|nr:GtrA family protein [Lachnospiraceae bacterium]